MTFNIDDIDASLSALNAALKEHYLRGEKLLYLILFGDLTDHNIIDNDSHLHCQFCEWLTLRMRGDTLDRNMVLSISRNHDAMHNITRMLMQAVVSGTTTKELVSQYHGCQLAFIDSIETYRSSLSTFRNQHDTLTGLPLRHLLYQEYPSFLERCRRNLSEFYVLMLDIDRFKSINDTWGHNAGDEVLRLVASRLSSATRRSERLYRFGGEEFIILLETKGRMATESAAERIRCNLSSYEIIISGQLVHITVTGGLTRVEAHEELHSVIARADNAMYYGKNNGRNCCVTVMADGEPSRISI